MHPGVRGVTQFEFLMGFASVILAVALAEILGGWGKLARSSLPVRWSGLWVGWSLVVVAVTVMYWSGMWPYRDQSFREGYKIFWLAIPTFFLVVLSYLLSPEPKEGASEVDLDARYWQISPRMFPLLAMLVISSTLADVVILAGLPDESSGGIAFVILAVALLVASALVEKRWLHWATLAFMSVPPLDFLFGGFGEIFR